MRVNNLTLTSDRRGGAVWKWYSFSDPNFAEEYLNGPKRFLNFPDCLQIILSERLALHLQIVVRMSIPHDLEKHSTVHPNTVLEPRFGLLIILLNCSKLCHDNICPASVTNIILYTWLSRETNPRPETWCGGQNSAQREVWERPYSEEGTSALSALSRLQDPADKQPELVEMPFSAELYNLYISEETPHKHCFFGVFKSILIYCSGLYPISGWSVSFY